MWAAAAADPACQARLLTSRQTEVFLWLGTDFPGRHLPSVLAGVGGS